MNLRSGRACDIVLILALSISLSACGGSPKPQAEPTPSSPTRPPPQATATATPTTAFLPSVTPRPTVASRCEGLAGQLEIQILVGPAEAVGLEPVAVGSVPFAVTSSAPPYLVEGQAPISYEATLTEQWGTYEVTMDMQTAVQGSCSGQPGSEQLDLVLEMSGEQLVVVEAEGFQGEYPWTGTQSRDLTLPLQEGASAQGEGWGVVLHLGSP
jgi:hypothetical protein